MNLLRNQKNLDALTLDEIRNDLEKEKILRMLDKQGIEQLQSQIESQDIEIYTLKSDIRESRIRETEIKAATGLIQERLMQMVNGVDWQCKERLRQREDSLITLKQEIHTLRGNKVFVIESGRDSVFQEKVYSHELKMGVNCIEYPKKILSNLNTLDTETGNSKAQGYLGPQSIENTMLDSNSEMESILQSRFDILEDNHACLINDLKQKDDVIQDLQSKFKASKKILDENMKIICEDKNLGAIKIVLKDPRKAQQIHTKLKFFNKLLKIGYGACIDLFLQIDQDGLIKLEKKLNNCIQVNAELNDLIFS